jgi:hypothetical protein
MTLSSLSIIFQRRFFKIFFCSSFAIFAPAIPSMVAKFSTQKGCFQVFLTNFRNMVKRLVAGVGNQSKGERKHAFQGVFQRGAAGRS